MKNNYAGKVRYCVLAKEGIFKKIYLENIQGRRPRGQQHTRWEVEVDYDLWKVGTHPIEKNEEISHDRISFELAQS